MRDLSRWMVMVAVATMLLAPLCGCGALIGAGFRELSDHGDDARYENKHYLEHVGDELADDRRRKRHHRHHHHRHCHH